MIPKGSQRKGGQRLATHLLNEFDNDRVEVAQVRGAIAQDLHGAFAEWEATAKGTRCRKYLYSLSVNPDPDQGPLTREQYVDFVERAEEKLGLTGQPRALIFHVKHGREHIHVVWSRIDTEKMRAVQLSHDRHALRSVVIDFARDHGLDLPRGVTRDRTRDGGPRRRSENLAEKQQEERTGQTREERMRLITEAWHQSHDGRSLIRELEARGFLLARGDRRAYVVVGRFGEIHSLPRQIEGVRTKDVKERLATFPLDGLPDAKKAQAFAREQRENVQTEQSKAKELAQERSDALAAAHAERRARVDQKREALVKQHQLERETLREAQEAQKRGIAAKRVAGRPKGVLAFLTRITGIQHIMKKRDLRQDEQRAMEHQNQRETLRRRHRREMQDFDRHYRSLNKVEAREKRSLAMLLRREEFARIAGRPAPPKQPLPPAPSLTPVFGDAAGRGKGSKPPLPSAPPLSPVFVKAAGRGKGSQPPLPPAPQLTPIFGNVAGSGRPPEPITPTFREAAKQPKPPERKRANGGLSDTFEKATSGTSPPPQKKDAEKEPDPGSLSEEFKRALKERAEKTRKDRERDRDSGKSRGPNRER